MSVYIYICIYIDMYVCVFACACRSTLPVGVPCHVQIALQTRKAKNANFQKTWVDCWQTIHPVCQGKFWMDWTCWSLIHASLWTNGSKKNMMLHHSAFSHRMLTIFFWQVKGRRRLPPSFAEAKWDLSMVLVWWKSYVMCKKNRLTRLFTNCSGFVFKIIAGGSGSKRIIGGFGATQGLIALASCTTGTRVWGSSWGY